MPSNADATTGTVAANLQAVRQRIAAATDRSGRNAAAVTLVAVSKLQPFERIQEALAAGQREFGENRFEELWEKVALAREQDLDDQIRWHMIGTIQSRKTAQAIGPFALIHSVDRVKIARRLHSEAEEAGVVLPVLLEINVSGEESKHGFSPRRLREALPDLLQYTHLRYDGFMTMAPFVEDPEETRPVFRQLRQLLESMRSDYPAEQYENVTWRHLSMGMTNDFEVAVEEGATIVRVGTAIFGERAY